MLPTAPHLLGSAMPEKLLKHQSQVANPPPQGSESRQLFLFTGIPSAARQEPSPTLQTLGQEEWGGWDIRQEQSSPSPAESLGEHRALKAAKLHLPRKAPAPAA